MKMCLHHASYQIKFGPYVLLHILYTCLPKHSKSHYLIYKNQVDIPDLIFMSI